MIGEDDKMAALLQEHYSGVYRVDVRGALEAWDSPNQESLIEDMEISKATVYISDYYFIGKGN